MAFTFRINGVTTLDGSTALPADTEVTKQAVGSGNAYNVTGPGGAAIATLGVVSLQTLMELAGNSSDEFLVLRAYAIDRNAVPAPVSLQVVADVGVAAPSYDPLFPAVALGPPPAANGVDTLFIYQGNELTFTGGSAGPFDLGIVVLPLAEGAKLPACCPAAGGGPPPP